MRDISELVGRQATPPPVEKLSDEDRAYQAYLEDLARFQDFEPEENKILWPSPVEPRWKN